MIGPCLETVISTLEQTIRRLKIFVYTREQPILVGTNSAEIMQPYLPQSVTLLGVVYTKTARISDHLSMLTCLDVVASGGGDSPEGKGRLGTGAGHGVDDH